MEQRKLSIGFLLLITVIFMVIGRVQSGFTSGAPCSERNTAYISPSRPVFPPELVKCVDITAMAISLHFQRFTPIGTADTLYADHMKLRNLTKIPFYLMPNLTMIDFTGNLIRKLPLTMGKMVPKMEILLLANNRVRIPLKRALLRSLSLTTLMLTGNKIRVLQSFTFSKLPALRVLYLDSNQLSTVSSKVFSHLRNLRYLHLGNNLLKSVPPRADMPPSLNIYIVKGNKLGEDADDVGRAKPMM